jgi:CBS domain-containing protein
MRTVNEIMTRNVKTIKTSATLTEAAKLMKMNRIGSLVVMDNDLVIGIITERDFAYKIIAEGKGADTKVNDIMSSDVKTIDPDNTLKDAAKLMASHVIKRLPVVSSGKLVGIISIEDIMRAEKIGEDSNLYSFT